MGLGRWVEECVEMLEGKEMAGREEDRDSSLRMGACKGEKEGVERSSECKSGQEKKAREERVGRVLHTHVVAFLCAIS